MAYDTGHWKTAGVCAPGNVCSSAILFGAVQNSKKAPPCSGREARCAPLSLRSLWCLRHLPSPSREPLSVPPTPAGRASNRVGLKGAAGYANPDDASTRLKGARAASRGSLVSVANETSKDEHRESFGGVASRGFLAVCSTTCFHTHRTKYNRLRHYPRIRMRSTYSSFSSASTRQPSRNGPIRSLSCGDWASASRSSVGLRHSPLTISSRWPTMRSRA
jgi:hypothetical protein